MKATKKQIEQVTEIANSMNFSVEMALSTLSKCSSSIYNVIGAKGVVESSMRANSKYFVDTLSLASKANKMNVSVDFLMTSEQIAVNL